MRSSAASTLLLLVAVAGAGCGGDAVKERPAAATPVGEMSAGSVVQFADCGDWDNGTREERLATVAALRGQLTPTRSTTAEGPLPDERAYDLFQKTCSSEFAQSLRLYKLYVRAQGFAPLAE